MKNREMAERFQQAHCARIERLFWIAGSLESSDLKELLEDLEDKDWNGLFPEIYKSKNFDEQRSEPLQALLDYDRIGLIAQIDIPECSRFIYKNKKPVSWSVHPGICRIEYVYAETLEELMTNIEKAANKVFQEYLKKDKEKQYKVSPA